MGFVGKRCGVPTLRRRGDFWPWPGAGRSLAGGGGSRGGHGSADAEDWVHRYNAEAWMVCETALTRPLLAVES